MQEDLLLQNQKLKEQIKDMEKDFLIQKVELLSKQIESQNALIQAYQEMIRGLKKTIKQNEKYIEISDASSFALDLEISDLKKELDKKDALIQLQTKEIGELKDLST